MGPLFTLLFLIQVDFAHELPQFALPIQLVVRNALAPLLHAQSPKDPLLSGMMRFADVSASQVVFVYGEDLWLVPRSGGFLAPLASPPGEELMPRSVRWGKRSPS